VEQTIGLASPSEVGEWVELIAGEELARRGQTISHIEVSSLSEQPGPQVSLPKRSDEPHSQVSSISVSRPAVSVTPPKRFAGAKLLVSISALLAVVGGGLGVLTMREVLAGARHQEAHHFEADAKRKLDLLPPNYAGAYAPAKAIREKEFTPVVVRQP